MLSLAVYNKVTVFQIDKQREDTQRKELVAKPHWVDNRIVISFELFPVWCFYT